ncbi:MAG: hypothetical protein IJ946_01500 [Clostridia bacterium]|nr:hypothetical protein [Clostridia bacterium]
MKRYIKEFIILVFQLFMFYVFPVFAGPTDAMGMVLLIIMATLLASFVLGVLSGKKIKYLYPVVISIIFIPTVFIWYNESALIHSVWYLVISTFGLLTGSAIRAIVNIIRRKIKG